MATDSKPSPLPDAERAILKMIADPNAPEVELPPRVIVATTLSLADLGLVEFSPWARRADGSSDGLATLTDHGRRVHAIIETGGHDDGPTTAD